MTMLLTSIDRYIKRKRGVIHVGAHDGEERYWYRSHGFKPVVWFEPNKDLFQRLEKNIVGFEGHVAFNVGIHDTLKEGILNISSNDGQSSSLLPLGTHQGYHPNVKYVGTQKVKLMRLDEFFREWSVADFNFLNVDVQGVELNVLRSLGELITRFDYIYTEVNLEELYLGCSLLPNIDDYLCQFDFYRLETVITKANWGDAFYKRYA